MSWFEDILMTIPQVKRGVNEVNNNKAQNQIQVDKNLTIQKILRITPYVLAGLFAFVSYLLVKK